MSAVTAEEVETVLAEARARKAALTGELTAAKADFVAASTSVNLYAYCAAFVALERQATRLFYLELWLSGLTVESRAL